MYKVDFKKAEAVIRETAGQRKEENKVFYSDHLKNLVKENDIGEIFYDSNSSECDNGFFILNCNEYKLARFSDIIFGKEKAASENDFIKVTGICFYYCDFSLCGFSNIIFEDCTFIGCNLTECYTLGLTAVFDKCSFTSRLPGKKSIDDMPSSFEGCEFTARFTGCDISQMVINKTHFYFSYFENNNISDSIFSDCSFDTVKLSGCDLRNSKIINARFIEFSIEDSNHRTKVNRNTFLGKINFNKKEKREVKYAAEVYIIFSELFENNKVMDKSGEYFFLNKRTEFFILEKFTKIKSFMGLATCGYGERPSYSLMTALILVLTCGILYLFFGVNANGNVILFNPTLQHPLPAAKDLIQCLHFSLVTFSTTGYGNVIPLGGSIIVSAAEMVLGVVMVGIWVSTLVRKMVR